MNGNGTGERLPDPPGVREGILFGGNPPGPEEAVFHRCPLCEEMNIEEDMVNFEGTWICLDCHSMTKDELLRNLLEAIEEFSQLHRLLKEKIDRLTGA